VLENPGKTYFEEFRFQHKDGSYYVFDGTGRSLPDEEKDLKIVISVRDISERLKSEKELKTQLDRLAALRAIDMAITASLDLRVTFRFFSIR
jgi:hypothetical protein